MKKEKSIIEEKYRSYAGDLKKVQENGLYLVYIEDQTPEIRPGGCI